MQENVASNGYNIVCYRKPQCGQYLEAWGRSATRSQGNFYAKSFADGSYNLTPKRSYSSQTQLCTCEKIRSRPVTMIQQPHPRTWNFISVFLIMKILTRPLFPHCPLWRALLSWLHTTALQLAALVWGVGHKASQWRTTVRQRTERLR